MFLGGDTRPPDSAPREAAYVARGMRRSGPGTPPSPTTSDRTRTLAVAKARERRSDPADLALRGRIGAHLLHARYDSRVLTAPARAAFLASFERAVDPDGLLPADERRRRAAHLRAAHFARLARLSALARRKRARRRSGP